MNRVRSTLGAALVAAMLASLAAVPSGADPAAGATSRRARVIDPATLPKGPRARIDHLQDGIIHTAAGARIRTRLSAAKAQTSLLGFDGRRWLVAWGRPEGKYGTRFGVSRVRQGRAPRRLRAPGSGGVAFGDVGFGWQFFPDGSALLARSFDRGGENLRLTDRQGRAIATSLDRKQALAQVYDVAGARVAAEFVDQATYARRRVIWDRETGVRTDLPRRTVGVDLAADRAWVWLRKQGLGFTSLANPGAPAWTAYFSPLAVSPDGAHVLGVRVSKRAWHDPAVLQLRRMADGRLLDAIRYGKTITAKNWHVGLTHEQTARWEDASTYVFQLTTDQGAVLVRCRLAGACERASRYGGDISTPGEYFLWW